MHLPFIKLFELSPQVLLRAVPSSVEAQVLTALLLRAKRTLFKHFSGVTSGLYQATLRVLSESHKGSIKLMLSLSGVCSMFWAAAGLSAWWALYLRFWSVSYLPGSEAAFRRLYRESTQSYSTCKVHTQQQGHTQGTPWQPCHGLCSHKSPLILQSIQNITSGASRTVTSTLNLGFATKPMRRASCPTFGIRVPKQVLQKCCRLS